MEKLVPASFFRQEDTVHIARSLLGMILETESESGICRGIITETEAYCGTGDRACHAWGGRRTRRNEPMYQDGGIAYIYLCYGIHHLFNIVTHRLDEPHAVLIRAIRPTEGIPLMLQRRGLVTPGPRLTRGPGAMSQAMGIHSSWSGLELQTGPLRIYSPVVLPAPSCIRTGPRIGVGYAGPDALLPYRFWLDGEPSVSKPPR